VTEQEIRLKCLELAMQQTRIEGNASNRETVAEITTLFYNLTQGTGTAPADSPKPQTGHQATGKGKKPGADKSVFD
jgi:hypothetical protein